MGISKLLSKLPDHTLDWQEEGGNILRYTSPRKHFETVPPGWRDTEAHRKVSPLSPTFEVCLVVSDWLMGAEPAVAVCMAAKYR